MTQPGKAPAGDVEVEKPKTATGEVPALGMMAVAKDGWAGEITLISPDGKFVFITDANGTRKRKSTGTVSITSRPAVHDDGHRQRDGGQHAAADAARGHRLPGGRRDRPADAARRTRRSTATRPRPCRP
jgi:hypothetical protein